MGEKRGSSCAPAKKPLTSSGSFPVVPVSMDGMNMAPPDQEWIEGVLEHYQEGLVRYARSLVGELALAQDVVQDVFLRLLRQDRRLLEGHLTQWLFVVCRNRALDYRRKEREMGKQEQEVLASLAGGEREPGAELERAESATALGRRLAGLPPRQREVVRLKFQEEMTYRDIAAVTGMTVNNVGVTLHAAMRRLRDGMPKGGQS